MKILHKRKGFTAPAGKRARATAKRSTKAKVDSHSEYFWSSASARALLSRDELADLLKIDSDLATVHRNRHLEVPNVSDVQQLPENLKDSMASAWGIAATGALATWGAYGARGQGMRVAVLDTGVDATHPRPAEQGRGICRIRHNGPADQQ